MQDILSSSKKTFSGSDVDRVRYHIIYVIIAIIVVATVLVGQIIGPSDIWDQDQPRTMSYTSNIVTHPENWVLPKQNNTFSATKPPLYNWVAAPFVAITEGRIITAHKSPSVIAFIAICVMLWWVGNRIDKFGTTGIFAVIAFSSNYTWYKLAYLARPDAILNLWVILGWIIVTGIFADCYQRQKQCGNCGSGSSNWKIRLWFFQFLIWISAALAILAKGPAGLLIPLYALLLSWLIYGDNLQITEPDSNQRNQSARIHGLLKHIISRNKYSIRFSGALWGIPLLIFIVGLWVWMAYQADPEHVSNVLLQKETMRRIPGIGDTTSDYGQWYWLRTSMNMPFYFMMRYLPWSICFIGALIDFFGKASSGTDKVRGMPHDSRYNPVAHIWLKGSLIFTILVIVFFSPVGGKRADYIASAYASASIVVGWWFTHLGFRIGRKRPWIVVFLAIITLSGLIIYDNTFGYNYKNQVSDICESFALHARDIIESDTETKLPVEFYGLGGTPIQSLMNRSQPDLLRSATFATQSVLVDHMNERLLSGSEPFWLIVQSWHMQELYTQEAAVRWQFKEVFRSEAASANQNQSPYEIVLLQVIPNMQNR